MGTDLASRIGARVAIRLNELLERAPACDWGDSTDPAEPSSCAEAATHRLQGMRCRHVEILCAHHAVVVLSPVVRDRPLLGIECSCGVLTPRAELSVVRL